MQTLEIVWQRLLSLGQTCDRCAATELALQQAVETLQQVLTPLQMQVEFHRQALTLEQFNQDPGASNRIWVADKPLEEWLGASTGSSRCCSVCGDAACRTLECNHQSYEAIPPQLLIKAGLLAAAQQL
jgi:hypothetical protein